MGILSELISPLLGQVKDVINAVHLDPAVKAQMEQNLAELQAKGEQADRDLEAKIEDIAGQNIRTDSSSSDWFVRRARPGFIWIVSLAIGVNLLVFSLVNAALGKGLTPIAIPADVMSIFKIAMIGYTGGRTLEKLLGKS